MPGGALTNFSCELRINVFLRPGSAGAPTASLATPMECSWIIWTQEVLLNV